MIRVLLTEVDLRERDAAVKSPRCPGDLNRSTQHFIFRGKGSIIGR